MNKSIRYQIQLICLVFIWIALFPFDAFSFTDIVKIKQAIVKKGVNWNASESWVTQLSFEDQKQLFGARLPKKDPDKVKLLSLPSPVSFPTVFDWRDNNGNWMTPVKNQGWIEASQTLTCGTCWDFASVAAIEAWWKIHHEKPDSQIDLSEQFILSCGELDCWSGGSAEYVYDFVRKIGIPTEQCFPYSADDTVPCDSACENWESEAVTIPGYGYITWDEAKVENIKSGLLRKPVVAYFNAYQDFLYYKDGVYEHVWGDFLYGHLVVIVGWNDDEQSWICKNSFGTAWGDSGYFRIKWGECLIGTYCPYIWDDLTDGPTLAATPANFDLSLIAGDSLAESLTIYNLGSKPLEYTILDMELTGDPVNWMAVADANGVLAGGDSAVAQVLINTSGVEPGNYSALLVVFFNDTTSFSVNVPVELQVDTTVVSVFSSETPKPTTSSLSQNYPNPFNPSTTIEYNLLESENIRLVIYDSQGKYVKTLVNTKIPAGHYQTTWDGTDVQNLPTASGVYFCRMEAASFVKVIKVLLIK